ncbi:glycosyltransferase AglE [Nanobdella aerobiophila]|uniref:Glycosyltransferase AglE n=1 Tax=Nanobdella aerobiophila TaxID=2586965 RepID=A0A915SFF7_9ARCH|nr:glycosyltransferase [Nanobdella aerobiophila]BBL45705.1 glycosyltransferase AglE [Nanobdella aerobiophila]
MDNYKLSFIFPIYKESQLLEENIEKIMNDPYPNELKEIIVTIDVPTDRFMETIRRIKDKYNNIKFIISRERRGKVSASNIAADFSTGDVLIFIDGDVNIRYINLTELEKKFHNYEIIELYKEVIRSNLVGNLLFLEYSLYYDIITKLFDKYNVNFTLNGGGFGIKKDIWNKVGGFTKVYTEDVDLLYRSLDMGAKYKLTHDIELEVEPLENFRRLFDQKKRWTFGIVETLLNHSKFIINFLLKYIKPSILSMITIFIPYVLWSYFYLFLPISFLYNISISIYSGLANNVSFIYLLVIKPKIIYSTLLIIYITGLYIFIGFLYTFILFSVVRKRIYNPIYFILFAAIYVPFYEIIFIYVLLYYIIFERPPKVNWKV